MAMLVYMSPPGLLIRTVIRLLFLMGSRSSRKTFGIVM